MSRDSGELAISAKAWSAGWVLLAQVLGLVSWSTSPWYITTVVIGVISFSVGFGKYPLEKWQFTWSRSK